MLQELKDYLEEHKDSLFLIRNREVHGSEVEEKLIKFLPNKKTQIKVLISLKRCFLSHDITKEFTS